MTTNNYNPNDQENQQLIDEIERSLKLIVKEGQVTELRAIGKGNSKYTESGYFTNLRRMAEEAARITEYANCVYFTPNPVNPDLLARCDNRTETFPKNTTSDQDIVERQWLLIDCDPIRPIGVSSTNAEKDAALAKARQIRQGLTERGWSEPITADSGNGSHLMYRIDLPNDDNGLVKRVLETLAMLFSDDIVKVDTVVHNPSRIWKLYGTWARKGDNTADRPHRMAGIIWDETPEKLDLVSKLQLEELARIIPSNPSTTTIGRRKSSQFDMEAWIAKHKLDVVGPTAWTDKNGRPAKRWLFHVCPWNSDHTNDSAYIVQFENGGIAAWCFHDGCKENNWQSLRKLYEPEYQPRQQTFALTDYGNAERLVAQHGENVRYSPQQKVWFVWDGKRWAEDDDGEIIRLAKATVRSIYTEAQKTDNDDRRREIVNWAVKSENEKRIKAMIDLAQSEQEIPIRIEDMDYDPYLLNCQNGVIDLRSGKLLPFNKDYYITKIIPVDWKGIEFSIDLWNDLLSDWTGGDESMKDFLQCAVGYSITGDTREEVLFFVHGPTSTGKSTFIEAIKKTLGNYTKTTDFEAFLKRSSTGGARNDIARLAGSRIVISIEVDKGKKLAEGLVKTITGNDTVTCRYLYKEAFEYKPTFSLWLVANDSPDVDPDDEAMWRRILRVPFDRSIPKESRNKNLKNELANPEVGSAILAWAVQGCLKWQAEGLKIPESVLTSTEEYRKEVDPFRAFLDEVCVVVDDNFETTTTLYNAYQLWADRNGEAQLDNNKPMIGRLRKIGCKPVPRRINGRQRRGWLGLKVIPEYRCPGIK